MSKSVLISIRPNMGTETGTAELVLCRGGNYMRMTTERAMEILDTQHREHYESIEPVNEACRMGREALKKQLPTRPALSGDGYADGVLVYDTWECPNCGEQYEVDCEKHKHCPNCGQAIDWSEGHE